MIISRTPFRISFFGGGTDYPAWFRDHGGAVMGTAINKYCYVTARRLPPFFEHRSRIVYSKVELVQTAEEIQHPAVRGVLADMREDGGLEIHHDADLPARSGLGSSSAFVVGLLNTLNALRGRLVSKAQLGQEAIRIEQDVLKEAVGCQDQLWAAHGGLNKIEFLRSGEYAIAPIILSAERREELRQSVMMFFTGFSRYASVIAEQQIKNVPSRGPQLTTMRQMVDEALDILCDEQRPIRQFGELLHDSWRLKRELSDKVTTPAIDEIYEAGMSAGAVGGKLLGAGGGGFMVFLVEPNKREAVLERLKHLIHVPINFDHEGSKIVFYQPDVA